MSNEFGPQWQPPAEPPRKKTSVYKVLLWILAGLGAAFGMAALALLALFGLLEHICSAR